MRVFPFKIWPPPIQQAAIAKRKSLINLGSLMNIQKILLDDLLGFAAIGEPHTHPFCLSSPPGDNMTLEGSRGDHARKIAKGDQLADSQVRVGDLRDGPQRARQEEDRTGAEASGRELFHKILLSLDASNIAGGVVTKS